MIELTLSTTQENFDQLHHDLDKTKSDAKFVLVNKEAMKRLLYDHTQLVCVCVYDFKDWIELVHGSKEATAEANKAFNRYMKGGELSEHEIPKAEERSDELTGHEDRGLESNQEAAASEDEKEETA